MRRLAISILCSLIIAMGGFYWTVVRPALAGVTCSLPFTLTNGTIADATQVMANYNALVTCLTNAAAAGANNDITSLSGLTTPITPNEGGSNVYLGTSVVASGQQIIISATVPANFTNGTLYSIYYISPNTNVSAIQVNVNSQGLKNVFKQTSAGPVALAGGETVTGQVAALIYDGTEYQMITTNGLASLTLTGQNLTGGANVTAFNLGTINGGGSINVACGNSPLQFYSNNGNMTVNAPGNDGSCDLLQTNAGGAGTVTFSGFTTNTNTGEALTLTNTNKFVIHIERINGTSTFFVKALQ